MNHSRINLQIIDSETDARWDDYVNLHLGGLIYHLSAWRQVLVSTFGYESYYVATQNGSAHRFEGALPLMLASSRLTGRRLVSLPFTGHCTPLLANSSLEQLVHFLARRCPGFRYLELRLLGTATGVPDILENCSRYVTHRLDLQPGQARIFKIGCSESIKTLDLGRSPKSHQSLIEFKSRWGALSKELTYCFYPKARRLDTEGGFARRLLGSINRLLPNRALRLEGELIYRHLG